MHQAADELGHQRQLAQTQISSDRMIHGTDTMIDQEARDLAAQALARETAHEVLCTERWNQQSNAMARVEVAVKDVKDKVDKQIGKVPAGVMMAMTGIIGFLAARAFPTH